MAKLFPVIGNAPKVQQIQAIAFYDREGRIHHMHHIIVLEGAHPVEREAMIQKAIAHANQLGVDTSELETLHVNDIKNPHVMHCVDIKERVLVEVEAPKTAINRCIMT